MASFGTHDLPPFAAYWTDADLEERRRMGLMDDETVNRVISERLAEKQALLASLQRRGLAGEAPSTAEVYRGATELLAESHAAWVMLSLEDTWGETRSQNVPGTLADQRPNWTQRAKHSLEAFDTLEDMMKTFELMQSLRPKDEGS
jgi:4-alpha-glucanotransferase